MAKNLKHHLITQLEKLHLDKVEAMMFEGKSGPVIVDQIREWGYHADVKLDTLKKAVNRYRNQVVKGRIVNKVEIVDEQTGETRVETLEYIKEKPNVDVMDDLGNLINLQKERINKLYAREMKMPTLMKSLQVEIKELRELLTKMAGLQMELGHLRRVPKKISIDDPRVLESKARHFFQQGKESGEQASQASADIISFFAESLDDIEDGVFEALDDADSS